MVEYDILMGEWDDIHKPHKDFVDSVDGNANVVSVAEKNRMDGIAGGEIHRTSVDFHFLFPQGTDHPSSIFLENNIVKDATLRLPPVNLDEIDKKVPLRRLENRVFPVGVPDEFRVRYGVSGWGTDDTPEGEWKAPHIDMVDGNVEINAMATYIDLIGSRYDNPQDIVNRF